jgi:poly(A) polymerase
VLYRLRKAGFQAYLVGGGVRDLLLGREPKDFDIATDALPEQVAETFRNCRLIGRRFRLAHVHFGREIIEVATFRGHHDSEEGEGDASQNDEGMLLRDNVWGSIEEDAIRRDFTVNALFYNIDDFSVVDYVGGVSDLQQGVLKMIGDAGTRYREDPVRMLRAVRFAAKLGFVFDESTEQPIFSHGHLLDDVPPARLFEEVLKLFHSGTAVHAFEKLRHYDLFRHLFPMTDESLAHEDHGFPIQLVLKGLSNTDSRIRSDMSVTPAFLFAVLLWEPVRQLYEQRVEQGEQQQTALFIAADQVISEQVRRIAIPRRFSTQMKEIWNMQIRLERSMRPGRAHKLMENPRFRAAYDFLLLRAESGETEKDIADWWTRIQQGETPPAKAGPANSPGKNQSKSKRRRRYRNRRKPADSNPSE